MANQDTQDLKTEDLDLVDDHLEDETKDEASLWSEFDQTDAGSAATDDPEAPHDEGGANDTGDDETAADGGQESDDGDANDGQSDGAQPSDADADIWANATPEQRAAFEAAQQQLKKLQQAERSNRGRLSAMQRQINMARQQQSQPAASQQQAAGEQPQVPGDGQQPDGFLASEDWSKFKEEYPEVAAPMEKIVGAQQSEITRLSKELSAIGNDRRQAALDEQASLLVNEHPDWQDVTADTGFVDWLQAQPRHIQEAAFRNANSIVDAAEAADVVGRFKASRSTTQHSAPANGPGKGKSNQALAGKRARQLESATATRSRGPGVKSGISENADEETIWKQFDEMERQAAR